MSNTFKFGAGNWAYKDGKVLAYNDENNNFKPLPFDFTRASSATRVNKAGLIEEVGQGVPRIDYTNDANGALLLEPSRTNLLSYSEAFDNAAWLKSGLTVDANKILSPYGSLDADEINITTANAHYLFNSISVSAETNYIFTFYVKKGTATDVSYSILNEINFTNIINTTSYFNEISDTEWTRISVEFTTPSGCTSIRTYPLRDGFSIGTVYIWGAQLEQGSYATSYIPTSGSTVTRVTETTSQNPNTSVIGQTEGSVFIDLIVNGEQTTNSEFFVLRDASSANRIRIIAGSFKRLRFIFQLNGGTVEYDFYSSSIVIGQRYKVAFTYKSGDIAVYINGSQADTSTNTLNISGTLDTLQLAHASAGVDIFDSKLYNTRLTNAELAALTA